MADGVGTHFLGGGGQKKRPGATNTEPPNKGHNAQNTSLQGQGFNNEPSN